MRFNNLTFLAAVFVVFAIISLSNTTINFHDSKILKLE
jgi:hypothetical protein